MNALLAGSLAGFAATAPMTVVMELMYRRLPIREQYPLPPRQITMEVAEETGLETHLDEGHRQSLTLSAHFAYGAAAGALYAPLSRKLPPLVGGVGFGLAVWAGSYLGWLPAVGLLLPATEHPPRRTALMIAAHVVWGAATGLLLKRLDRNR